MTAPILDLDLPPEHPLRQILDFISAHPEVRQPVLRALLTEDFLALPVQVQQLTDRVHNISGQVEELREDVASFKEETREQFLAVNERLDENTRGIDAVTQRLDAVTQRLDENIELTRSMRGAVGALRGDSYEDLCRKEIGVILDGWIDRPVLADRERINSLLRHARWRNEISRDEYLDALRPDVIAHETVGNSHPAHYAVVEASITFNRRDLENASRRAAVIARVIGARTDAFVATHGGDWPQEVDNVAQSLGVTIITHEAPEYSAM